MKYIFRNSKIQKQKTRNMKNIILRYAQQNHKSSHKTKILRKTEKMKPILYVLDWFMKFQINLMQPISIPSTYFFPLKSSQCPLQKKNSPQLNAWFFEHTSFLKQQRKKKETQKHKLILQVHGNTKSVVFFHLSYFFL